MRAKNYRCKIKDLSTLSDSIKIVRFYPQVEFKFYPGQFISLNIPNESNQPEIWRAYSMALPYELSKEHGYEICVRTLPNGKAGQYISTLKAGDTISIRAPYGDFVLRTNKSPNRGICLIGTGTGVAPLRAIALSQEYQKGDFAYGVALFGFRDHNELIYADELERNGFQVMYALSRESQKLEFPLANGRVTDILQGIATTLPWKDTDFYLCGNAEMINEVRHILTSQFGVSEGAIFSEAFAPALLRSAA